MKSDVVEDFRQECYLNEDLYLKILLKEVLKE